MMILDKLNVHSHIARKLVISIILVSSLVALCATAIQLYVDYKHDIGEVQNITNIIKASYLESLSNNIWVYNDEQVQIQLHGMMGLQYVEYIEIIDAKNKEWSAGKLSSKNTILKEFALVKEYKGKVMQLGLLRVTLGLNQIYSRLVKRALIILVSNSLKTFFVAGFIFLLVHRTITGRLTTLASKVRDIEGRPNIMDIQLNRPPDKADVPDEIDQVVEAINITNSNLRSAYANLEKDIAKRKLVEEELRTQTKELLRTNKAFVDRELKMVELKKEIEELRKSK